MKYFNRVIAIFVVIMIFFLTPSNILADWIRNSDNPIIDLGLPNSWDDNMVISPFVIFDGNIYKMWYVGNDGSTNRIGIATSSSGLVWEKFSNPVIDSLDSEQNKNISDPSLIFENGTYKVWYAAASPTHSNIHINYATSSDGYSWSNHSINVIPPTEIWETGNGITFHFILNQNNQYKMFYTGAGRLSPSENISNRLGFAESNDGLSWIKNPNPVMIITQSWEDPGGIDGISSGSVLYEDGVYKQFYSGRNAIGYAVSADGINWNKYSLNPIFSPSTQWYETQRVGEAHVIKRDGLYYLYYAALGNDNKWRIALATSDSLPVVSPPPTATPTNSPTLTPFVTATATPTLTITPSQTITPSPFLSLTPTNTPTVSPTRTRTPTVTMTTTPSPSRTPSPLPTSPAFPPVIILPGLSASWNAADAASCDVNRSGTWTLPSFVKNYDRLFKTLTTHTGLVPNYDVLIYGYDWRQPLDRQADMLKTYIDGILANRPPGTKVQLIGHSLGGLVARSYLEKYPASHNVERVITAGTPHLGSSHAYPLWEGSEIWSSDLVYKSVMTHLINHCRIKILRSNISDYKKAALAVRTFSPSVQDLLPTYDYIFRKSSSIPSSSLKQKNTWVAAHPFPANHYGIPFITLSGDNENTLYHISVVDPKPIIKLSGLWEDGQPAGKTFIKRGDGTVLLLSSQLPTAVNEIVSTEHANILSSTDGINKIVRFLGLDPIIGAQTPLSPAPELAASEVLTVFTDLPATVELSTPKSRRQRNNEKLLIEYEPEPGIYRVKIQLQDNQPGTLYVAAISKSGTTRTAELNIKEKARAIKEYIIPYNPNSSAPLRIHEQR